MKNAKPDVYAIFDTWIAGYESRDVAKLMSIFDADLQYHAPCQPVQNFESLDSWYKYDFGRKDARPTWTFRIDSIDVSGDLAVIVSRWSAVTNLDGFSANLERLRSIDFLRFGEQGWKIFRTINDPEDCGTPPKLGKSKDKGRGKKDKKRSKKR
jgi:hypothetical protein